MKETLHQLSIWIILLPLITGLWFNKNLSYKSLIILFLVIVGTPPQLSSDLFKKYTNILYNVYTPVEFYTLYFFFKENIHSNISKKILKESFVLYSVISLVVLSIYKSIAEIFIYEWVAINNLFYLLWILLYFTDQYLLPEMELTFNNPFCWSLLGIFIYAACTCLHFFLYAIIQDTYLSVFQSSFNILLYILFAISFWKDKVLKKQIKPEY